MRCLKKTTKIFIICIAAIVCYNFFLIDTKGAEATYFWTYQHSYINEQLETVTEYQCNNEGGFLSGGICSCLWGWRKDVTGHSSQYWNCPSSQT